MLSDIVSVSALVVSIIIAWLSFFRRTTVKMTQPTVITFEYTPPPNVLPSISINSLLFATPKTWPETRAVRGRVIESLYLKLSSPNNQTQSFSVWYHGNERGGLYTGEAGVAEKHRFFTSNSGRYFRFGEGQYNLEIFGRLVGNVSPTPLFHSIALTISLKMAQEMKTTLEKEISAVCPQGVSLQFDWEPELGYLPSGQKPVPPFQNGPDYGPPESYLPNGEGNLQNWMLFENQRERAKGAGQS